MRTTIRKATKNDLPKMYAITLSAHRQAYGNFIPNTHKDDFIRRYTFSDAGKEHYISKMSSKFDHKNWQIWVAEQDNNVVGYTLREWLDPCHLFLRGLFVHSDYMGQGIGRTLFEKSLIAADSKVEVKLVVVEYNDRAKKLYQQYGFRHVGYEDDLFFGARQEIMKIN